MKPSEISLFSANEQTLLVDTEAKRLEPLDEDALSDLLTRVRRSRNKYSDLHRRQSAEAVKQSGRRSTSSTSNERTTRKAEIFEDAVSRVARYLSRAARANANELKSERLAAARSASSKPVAAKKGRAAKQPHASASRGKTTKEIIEPARKGATSAANKRRQSGKDRPTKSKR